MFSEVRQKDWIGWEELSITSFSQNILASVISLDGEMRNDQSMLRRTPTGIIILSDVSVH